MNFQHCQGGVRTIIVVPGAAAELEGTSLQALATLPSLAAGGLSLRIALAVIFGFIFEAVGIPTLASQTYASPLLDFVLVPVVWIAAFVAVRSLVQNARSPGRVVGDVSAAFSACRSLCWLPSCLAKLERFDGAKLSAFRFLIGPGH